MKVIISIGEPWDFKFDDKTNASVAELVYRFSEREFLFKIENIYRVNGVRCQYAHASSRYHHQDYVPGSSYIVGIYFCTEDDILLHYERLIKQTPSEREDFLLTFQKDYCIGGFKSI